MKKLFISLMAVSAMLTSCNMDTPAPGVLDDATAISDVSSAEYFRNTIYNGLRVYSAGSPIYGTELAMDQFIGLSTNGNRGSQFANGGEINSSNTSITGFYGGCYSRIADANYFIEKANALLDGGSLNKQDALEVKRYIGEAHFARAYYYFFLLDHYCPTYDKAKGDQEGLGLQIQLVYNPTGDTSKYPGRSSMNASIKVINDDLDAAYKALKAYEDAGNAANTVAGSSYLSSYAVEALRARFALAIGDYETAVTSAQAVIANTNYQLLTGQAYVDMWNDANVSELIFSPFVDATEAAYVSSTCDGWNEWWSDVQQSDYIPTSQVVWSYTVNDSPNDWRFFAFFKATNVKVQGGTTKTYVFNKYPGNDALITDGTNYYKNTPKPFRLSEQYLILAEAAAMAGGKEDIANDAYNELIKNRYRDYAETNLVGQDLIDAIRYERGKELIGEGFRMSDLRRWKIGFDRDQEYDLNPLVAESRTIAGLNTSYAADDYRYVWPIPYDEMAITPALAGQQNPGY